MRRRDRRPGREATISSRFGHRGEQGARRSAALRAAVLGRLFEYLSTSPRTDSPAVRERLLQTVLDRRMVVLLGAIGSLAIAFGAITLTSANWPWLWIAADLTTVVARWAIIARTEGTSAAQKERWIPTLLVLGAGWSLLLGLAIYACILTGMPGLIALAAMTGAATMASIASRNAATPRYAIFVILLIHLPFVAGAIQSSYPGMDALAILLLPWLASLYMLVSQNHAIMLRLIEAELTARRLAETDPLTGLYNRSCLKTQLDRLASRASDAGYSLLCVDLDGFKGVNDSHGHAGGDEVLRLVAARMRKVLRREAVVFRLGGDEFLVLLESTDPADCERIAARLIEAISSPGYVLSGGDRTEIGASVGSACTRSFARASETVLHAADMALYRAKARGKGVHVHEQAA